MIGDNPNELFEEFSGNYRLNKISGTDFIFESDEVGLYYFSAYATDASGESSEEVYFYIALQPDLDGDAIYDDIDEDVDGDCVLNRVDR